MKGITGLYLGTFAVLLATVFLTDRSDPGVRLLKPPRAERGHTQPGTGSPRAPETESSIDPSSNLAILETAGLGPIIDYPNLRIGGALRGPDEQAVERAREAANHREWSTAIATLVGYLTTGGQDHVAWPMLGEALLEFSLERDGAVANEWSERALGVARAAMDRRQDEDAGRLWLLEARALSRLGDLAAARAALDAALDGGVTASELTRYPELDGL